VNPDHLGQSERKASIVSEKSGQFYFNRSNGVACSAAAMDD
jgi:hypothetical protein